MWVTHAAIGTLEMTSETARDGLLRAREGNSDHNAVSQLRAVGGLCNSGEFDASTYHLPLHERKMHGDATDQAVLRFSESLGPVSDLREAWIRTFELAFNSKNKFMIRTFMLAQKLGLEQALPFDERGQFGQTDT